MPKCPQCQEELIKDISYDKDFLGHYKNYNSFCLSCNFINKLKIKISKDYYLLSLNRFERRQ